MTRKNISTRALAFLRICTDQTLKRPAVILSLEDDPVTGMPEDIPDGVSMDALKVAFKLLSPEPLAGISWRISLFSKRDTCKD